MSAAGGLPRLRLWMKLAAFAAIGVVVMHAAHVALGTRMATRGLADEQAVLGANVARLVAEQAADPILVNDVIMLHELVSNAVTDDPGGVAYCFVVRDGRVVASSLGSETPEALVRLRAPGDARPVIVRSGPVRRLDLVHPILGGTVGEVRVGLDLRILEATRRSLAMNLGVLALALIAAGALAALWVARAIARPLGDIVAAADRFDPARDAEVPDVSPRGAREIAILGQRFDRMMRRLRSAHAEQQRARQKALETERMAALGSLVAGVAHEVNNPLAGLKNCVRRLERDDLPEPKRREYLALMEEGLGRIEEVVRELLDFGRPHPPRLVPVPPDRLARESIALVRPLLERRGAHAKLDASGAMPPVLADRRLAEQAVVNLLLNAAYVTARDGEVRVRLRRRAGQVGIAVEDDGPGIPADVRERVLDPFFSTKPEGEGTGLGLSVTRTILDAHGGELTFEFPARGTIATVWFREVAATDRATG